jgi:hypothetical protein
VQAAETVRVARDASAHYRGLELALAEWGPDLETRAGDPDWAGSMDAPLHAATVLALGGGAFGRSHRAILWDFHDAIQLGLARHDGTAKPLARAYALLARMIGPAGADLLRAEALPDGGALLATRDGAGTLRVLLVNRSDEKRKARVSIDGRKRRPLAVYVFDDPAGGIASAAPKKKLVLPPRSLLVAEY